MVRSRRLIGAVLLGATIRMTPATPAAAEAPQPLFAFIYRPGPAWKPGVPMMEQNLRPHGAYIAGLAKAGQVLGGGGFVGVDGGMAIVRATDAAEAARLLAADPAITAGVFEADLRQWRPSFGADADLAPPRSPRLEPPGDA